MAKLAMAQTIRMRFSTDYCLHVHHTREMYCAANGAVHPPQAKSDLKTQCNQRHVGSDDSPIASGAQRSACKRLLGTSARFKLPADVYG